VITRYVVQHSFFPRIFLFVLLLLSITLPPSIRASASYWDESFRLEAMAYGQPAYGNPPAAPRLLVDDPVKGQLGAGQAAWGKPVGGLLEGWPLVNALQQGGYVMYFRYAATDRTQTDTDTTRLKNCRTQRNLTVEGRSDAREIGRAFANLQIPVGLVLSSEYCRARETALLAFGWAKISEGLSGYPEDIRAERNAFLAQLLSTPPKPGMNTILVGHEENIATTAGIAIGEGEAAVFSPLGEGGFSLVGRVQPKELRELAASVYSGSEGSPSLLADVGVSPATNQVYSSPSIQAAGLDLLLPDLQTAIPTDVRYQVIVPNEEEVIRFTNYIKNAGNGPLEIKGVNQTNTTLVYQRVYATDGSVVEYLAGEFIYHPAHNHFHFENFARYELWSLTPAGELDAIVAVSDKVSYCLRDNDPFDHPNRAPAAVYTECGMGTQGISVGWMDIYKFDIAGQTINIANVPVGVYALRSVTDPANQLMEVDDTNNEVIMFVEILVDGVQVVRNPALLYELFIPAIVSQLLPPG